MQEKTAYTLSGWLMLFVIVIVLVVATALFIDGVTSHRALAMTLGIFGVLTFILLAKGLFTLQPNEARILILFGKYPGTAKTDGFHWANPFQCPSRSFRNRVSARQGAVRGRSLLGMCSPNIPPFHP
jgi:hypothetical protein